MEPICFSLSNLALKIMNGSRGSLIALPTSVVSPSDAGNYCLVLRGPLTKLIIS
jgi:hypothetical protein